MATQAFTITEASDHDRGVVVDRDNGIIRDVKILGLVSENNRRYLPEAVKSAKHLYEGIKVNINHPESSGDQRNAEDRFGKLINVYFVEGEGLYGDLMFLKSHPMAERVCEAAERMTDVFGLSHNAQGDGIDDRDGCFVIKEIVSVRHVDLVSDPATTRSLSEALPIVQKLPDRANKPQFDDKTRAAWDEIRAVINAGLHYWEREAPSIFHPNSTPQEDARYNKKMLGRWKAKLKAFDAAREQAGKKGNTTLPDSKWTVLLGKPKYKYDLRAGESDMSYANENTKATKEAGGGGIVRPIFSALDGNVKQAQTAIKSAAKVAAGVRSKLKGSAGAKLYALLTNIMNNAEGAIDTAIMQLHSAQLDPSWIESKESDMPYDKEMPEEEMMSKEEMMKEEEKDMKADEDPIEEEVSSSEVEDAYRIGYELSNTLLKLTSLIKGIKAEDNQLFNQYLSGEDARLQRALTDIRLLTGKLGKMSQSLDESKDGMEADEPDIFDEEPSEEVEPDMEELDKKAPMESIRSICRANGISPTKELLEDFKGMSIAKVKRHIGRLKLAKLSRKPRSAAPASEISESKIPTDVFSWLRS